MNVFLTYFDSLFCCMLVLLNGNVVVIDTGETLYLANIDPDSWVLGPRIKVINEKFYHKYYNCVTLCRHCVYKWYLFQKRVWVVMCNFSWCGVVHTMVYVYKSVVGLFHMLMAYTTITTRVFTV